MSMVKNKEGKFRGRGVGEVKGRGCERRVGKILLISLNLWASG